MLQTIVGAVQRTGLRARLYLLVALVALPAAVVLSVNAAHDRQQRRVRAEGELSLLSQLVAGEFAAAIATVSNLTRLVGDEAQAERTEVLACAPVFSHWLEGIAAVFDFISGIAVFDLGGQSVCAHRSLAQPIDISDRAFFRDALTTRSLTIGDPIVGRITGEYSIPVASPVLDEHDNVFSIVAATIPLKWLATKAEEVRREDLVFVVVKQGGAAIARVPDHPGTAGLVIPIARRAGASGGKSGPQIIVVDDGAGTERIWALAPVSTAGESLYVGFGVSARAFYLQADAALWRGLLILAAFAALALLLARYLGQRLLFAPILDLIAGTKSLAAGSLSARVNVSSPAEIAVLGHAFNDMAEAFQKSDAHLRAITDNAPDGIITIDEGGTVRSFNPGAERIFGIAAAEAIGQNVSILMPSPDHERHDDYIARYLKTGEARMMGRNREVIGLSRDGTPIALELALGEIHEPDHIFIGILRDLRARKATEAQLLQAQKMEAIGQLTGGVAHDFNNLLGVVIGNLDLLQDKVEHDPDMKELVGTALRASLRGAELTRALLAFSRRQALQPRVFALEEIVSGLAGLLQRMIGQSIEVTIRQVDGLWPVRADPAQLESAVLNLAVNARDAMPQGGRLTIDFRNIVLVEAQAWRNPGVEPGEYVEIAVSDTGTGMSQQVAARAFEPFFTTKEPGKGSGLGLSMVYGFAQQSGGHVTIRSEEGRGTTVALWLPRGEPSATDLSPAAETGEPRGNETILVVEDDADLRPIITRQLRELGYAVIEAETGEAGLDILKGPVPVDLLLTDMVMPGGMEGTALARDAAALRAGLRVLYMSGFAESAIQRPTDNLLNKPFRRPELALRVRRALDG